MSDGASPEFVAGFVRELLSSVDRCAEILNLLPFVRWDRCVRPPGSLLVYGWIDRDDSRSDFVLLEFDDGALTNATTSSARYSAQISKTLFGIDGGHHDCEAIRDVFGDRVNRTVGG